MEQSISMWDTSLQGKAPFSLTLRGCSGERWYTVSHTVVGSRGGGRRRKRAIYDVERIQTQETGSTVDLVTFFHHFQLPMNSFGSLPLTAFLAFSHSSFPCHPPPPPPVLPSLLPNRSLLSSSSPLPLQLVIMNHMVNPHSYLND